MAFLFRTSNAIEGNFDQDAATAEFVEWTTKTLGLGAEIIRGASHGIWWVVAEVAAPQRRRYEFGGGQFEEKLWIWFTVELPELAVIERPRLEPLPSFVEAFASFLGRTGSILDKPTFCKSSAQVEEFVRESQTLNEPTLFFYGGKDDGALTRSQEAIFAYVRGLARVVVVPELFPPPALGLAASRGKVPLPGSVITISRFRTRVLPSRALQRRLPAAGRLLQQQISELNLFKLPVELQRSRRRASIEQARATFGENDWIELIDEQERKITELETRSIALQETLDSAMLEVLDYESELKLTSKQVRQLAWQLANPLVLLDDSADDLLELEPLSCIEVLEVASTFLEHLTITANYEDAGNLDAHQLSPQWARMAWKLLLGLNEYAESKRMGFKGNLFAYASNPPVGARPLYPERVALNESETTDASRSLRASRTFPVPSTVDRSGVAYMPAHLKVGSGGHYPRIHFFDDTQGDSGTVIVGYFGKHLPTAKA